MMDKRQLIKDTAFSLFVANGYEQTSVAEISSNVGISKGSIYTYYHTKQDILEQILFENIDEIEDTINKLELNRANLNVLDYLLNRLFIIFNSNPLLFRLYFQNQIRIHSIDLVFTSLQSLYHKLFKKLENYFESREYKKPEIEATFCISVITGILFDYTIMSRLYKLTQIKYDFGKIA